MLTMAHLKAVLSDPGKVPLPQSRLDFSDLHSLQTSKKTDMEREEWTVSFVLIYLFILKEQRRVFIYLFFDKWGEPRIPTVVTVTTRKEVQGSKYFHIAQVQDVFPKGK